MDTILLLLTTTRETPKTADYMFSQAKKGKCFLDALFILDPGMGQALSKKLEQTSFLGESSCSDIAQSLTREYHQRGREKLDRLRESAVREGLELRAVFREGDVAEECLRAVELLKPKEVILTKVKSSRLSRFIFSRSADRIQARAGCPVTVIEE